jgi:hypothetical protein
MVGVIVAAGCAKAPGTGEASGSGGASGSGTTSGSGAASGSTSAPLSCPPPEPGDHRPSAVTCPPPPIFMCTTDADCSDYFSMKGTCDGGSCNFDVCTTDSDCSSNEVCNCQAQGGPPDLYPNTCLGGNCRVDADCGAGFFCSPSYDITCPGVQPGGYYCHTCQDECTNDSDCNRTNPTGSAAINVCMVDDAAGYWLCVYSPCGD